MIALILVGIERDDTEIQVDRMLERILGYRVFEDDEGRMNLSLGQTGGGLLLVPQFTLAADTKKGMRASFGPAAEPEQGRRLFERLLDMARGIHSDVATGVFGAHMKAAGEASRAPRTASRQGLNALRRPGLAYDFLWTDIHALI